MSANGPQPPGGERRGSPEELDPQLWQRIDALLSEALTLPEDERERWLSGLSQDDQPLAPGLRAILARAARTDAFMRHPVSPAALSAAHESSSLEREGTMVGPYRLLRALGAGGMGQVWLAERTDGTIQRQVAIKLPRTGWAPGMAERLQQERDALAALEHPNIARLYDAGTTETGRPYIAMEYVDGVPIDRYAITHSLTLRERLSLFLQVAGAVSYAHARLIVHRDLKPSNILVSESQGVRLLDFGAAKLLREDVPGDSELTRELGPALSPEYASPEQIRGERVTVATDVYSLGVVLYEILTGERPYRLPRESWAALVEAVSRVNVPLASSRVGGDPKLTRSLRGDLDAVLAKTLRREPGDRYPSVQAFADDVSRYLSGEPVRAKNQSVGERALKFVRRHAIAVGTAATVTLLVGVASGVAFWQARVARAQAARAERVRQFIASILTGAVPKTGVGGVVTASDLLSAAAGRIETELSGEPAVAAELGVIVGDSFDNLGEPGKAEPVYRAAAARAEATFGRTHPLTLEAKTDLATELAQHDVPGALVLIEEVIPEARKGLPATAALAVEALKDQSFALAKLNRPEPSYGALRESIQLAEKYFGPLDERTISGVELLANTYGRFGDGANELATATDAVDRARRAFGAQRPHNTLLATERTYADALRRNDRPADSAVILRGVVADQRRLDAGETIRVRNAKLRLGNALYMSGRLEEGLSLVREVVALEREQNPAESDDRLAYGMALASGLAAAERTEEWLAEEDRLVGIVARLGTQPHGEAVRRHVRRARLFALLGKSREAQALVAEAVSMTNPADEALRVQAELVAALDARLQLHLSEARALLERTVGGHTLETLPPKVQSDVAAELGTVRLELGDPAGAEKELVRCQELFRRAQVEPSIPVSTCLVGAARLDLRQGRFTEAEEVLAPVAAAWERVNPDSPHRGEVLHWLARAENGAGKVGAARRDTQLADSLLRRSKLPALRRLVETRLTARLR
jgi:tetratricopeptide (TPR) repeat protein